MINSYRDLIVWQKSMELVVEVYKVTNKLPREETYGLSTQMRRAAVSMPSNIAEGKLRGYRKEYRRFLLNAFGSGGELETQVEIIKQLYSNSTNINLDKTLSLLGEVMRMLNSLINKLKPNVLKPNP